MYWLDPKTFRHDTSLFSALIRRRRRKRRKSRRRRRPTPPPQKKEKGLTWFMIRVSRLFRLDSAIFSGLRWSRRKGRRRSSPWWTVFSIYKSQFLLFKLLHPKILSKCHTKHFTKLSDGVAAILKQIVTTPTGIPILRNLWTCGTCIHFLEYFTICYH